MAMSAVTNRPDVPGQPNHPRRPAAQSSVSLRHAATHARANRGSGSTSSSSSRLEPSSSRGNDSPSSLRPHMGRDSSGQSSNAEHWFNKSNNQLREGGGSFGDSEPPFFMRNSSSLETPPDAQLPSLHLNHASDSLPLRTELLQLGTPGSGTDDFRGVIDDLTVQNKRLKRRLKKYEKLHDAHLKDDKLFEVRIHGLPSEKKRELEDMLRKFASSLGTTGDNAFPADGYNSLLPMLNKQSVHATAQPSDSAYASMSLSGPGSSAVSATDRQIKATSRDQASARQKNIHSYLHDIPTGLLPQQAPTNMTERARKKLVVRKVEQLFVGKGAVGGQHHHPIQQQEVSQSAAQADRSARAEAGQSVSAYGSREAQMLARKRRANDNATSPDGGPGQEQQHAKSNIPGEKSGHPDVEQRPTQPIDLDPDRAQIPQDNIRYMRSMGFSPPHPDTAPIEGHGWIYINFLFNMAQLHTLHVTPDFVRDAMHEVSKRLEVSADGRKVRWRGGGSVTRSSSICGTPKHGSSSERLDGESPRKRPKLMRRHESTSSRERVMGGASARVWESKKHSYTPMFHHKSGMDSDDSSSEEEEGEFDDTPDQRWDTLGDSSGVTSSGVQSTPFNITAQKKRKRGKRDDGPIIFYNNARFCTDLSGERRPMASQNVPIYNTVAVRPVGDSHEVNGDSEGRGPLAEAESLPDPMNLSDNPIGSSQELSILPFSPPKPSSSRIDHKPIDLEVTGIGGVWPEDNFALNVETRHAQVVPENAHTTTVVSKDLPSRFASILFGSQARNQRRAKIGHEVTDVEVKRMRPSELPPALGYMDCDDETSDSDSESDASVAPGVHAPDALPPEVSTQPLGFFRYSSDDSNASDAEDEESDEESDDGEVDLLADIRRAHPEFVRAQERQYDANMAERLAEELPTGSSAATAGAGSGFASPASGIAREDVRQAREALGTKPPPAPKRNGTGNRMAVQGLEGSDYGSDDDDDMSDMGS